jgi:hypothetical protein
MRTRRTGSLETVQEMRTRRSQKRRWRRWRKAQVGRHVAKYFNKKVHYGIVEADEEPYWRVRYDDDDEEHFNVEELKEHLRLYEEIATLGEDESGLSEGEEGVERVFPCEVSETEDDEEMERVFIQKRTLIYEDKDKKVLSAYQCLLRKQIEIFETGPDDVGGDVQGQINAIRLGQVRIRCRHCASLAKKARASSGVYYSKSIRGFYQLAVNLTKFHLEKNCKLVDKRIAAKLAKLRQTGMRSARGTKEYWAERLRVMGLYKKEGCVRLRKGNVTT